MRKLSQSVDVISAKAPLDGYKLVVAPNLNVLPKDVGENLLRYVRSGGHLVLGPRSGLKDEHNELLTQRQPGYLADALGGRVEQYYAVERDFGVSGNWGAGQASIWAEQLSARDADTQILMRYGKSNGWLDDQPAAISRAYGKGKITYIGAILDEKLMKTAAEWMVKESGVGPAFASVPDGVEISERSGVGKSVFVLINFAPESQKVDLGKRMRMLLSDRQGDSVELAPYGVEVLQAP